MFIVQINGSTVVLSVPARSDCPDSHVVLVESIPTFEPKEGYNGSLMYSDEQGLYWEYIEAPMSDEISPDEALNIILGGETV